jgi:hypothetical protein
VSSSTTRAPEPRAASTSGRPPKTPSIPTETGSHVAALGSTLDFMRLLWAMDHGLQRRSKRMEVEIGVTGMQRVVIRLIGRFPNVTAGRLAELVGGSKGFTKEFPSCGVLGVVHNGGPQMRHSAVCIARYQVRIAQRKPQQRRIFAGRKHRFKIVNHRHWVVAFGSLVTSRL